MARSAGARAPKGPWKRSQPRPARVARVCALGHVPFTWPPSPGAYKYPPGVFSLRRSRALASFRNLVFWFIVVVVVVLLVVVLAIRVKERECVSVVLEG